MVTKKLCYTKVSKQRVGLCTCMYYPVLEMLFLIKGHILCNMKCVPNLIILFFLKPVCDLFHPPIKSHPHFSPPIRQISLSFSTNQKTFLFLSLLFSRFLFSPVTLYSMQLQGSSSNTHKSNLKIPPSWSSHPHEPNHTNRFSNGRVLDRQLGNSNLVGFYPDVISVELQVFEGYGSTSSTPWNP